MIFSLRDGSTPSTQMDIPLNQVSWQRRRCVVGLVPAGGRSLAGSGCAQGDVGPVQLIAVGLVGPVHTLCHLHGHAHHTHLCTYMGVCRRAGEIPWLCLDAQGTDTH